MENPLLEIQDLSISFTTNKTSKTVVKKISFQLYTNEILGIVGESGSGKTVSCLVVMGLLPQKKATITEGTILFKGNAINSFSTEQVQQIRGNKIAMIFQEPMSALNPSMRCGKQVVEVLLTHTKISKKEAKQKVLQLFEEVKLPQPERIFKAFPHEISGGQMQRVMIAMAIACEPNILIADEPTTALDVTVQKEIITLLKDLQAKTKMSIIFITHDLALLSEIANRVLVMYKGEIVEQGTVRQIYTAPKNKYTKALIKVRPSLQKRFLYLPTIADYVTTSKLGKEISLLERKEKHEKIYKNPPILEIQGVEKIYITKNGFQKKPIEFKALDKISFSLYEGETLGLVGESGCGKSTLGNTILNLNPATSGSIKYKGKELVGISNKEMRVLRKEIQIIFQDPYASLNPRLTVGEAITEPMLVHNLYKNASERKSKAIEILEAVGLPEDSFYRFPHEFSGGQRQRIGIARTIAVQPKIIICDESVSALDISVQAQVLNLLNKLKEQFKFTYIFISHDLAVVKHMADQLVVMHKGKIEEIGEADTVYKQPQSAYTKALIDAIPKGI